jgi:hypothetical protein
MEYCLTKYEKEMDLTRWAEFCKEYHIEEFTHRAIEAVFNDPILREETMLFAKDIGELARRIA